MRRMGDGWRVEGVKREKNEGITGSEISSTLRIILDLIATPVKGYLCDVLSSCGSEGESQPILNLVDSRRPDDAKD